MKKTILLFDSWSFGYKFFEFYVDEFVKNGYHVCFVHMDKLQLKTLHNPKSVELKEYSDFVSSKIESYDISEPDMLKELIERYPSPDFLLHLSISHLENRLFNLLYRNSGAAKLYVQHGNIFGADSAAATIRSLNRFRSNFNARFLHKLNKIKKLFFSYFKYGGFIESASLLIQWLQSPRKFVLAPSSHASLDFDLAFSFSEEERKHLAATYSIPLERIFVITNPEIFLLSNYANKFSGRPQKIVFIDQALVESGIISMSDQIYDYSKCKELAYKLKMDFVIRPHPRTIIESYSEQGFYFESKSFKEMLSENCIYIGYNSSLIKTLLELGFYVIQLMPELPDFRSQSILSAHERDCYSLRYFDSNASQLADTFRMIEFRKMNGVKPDVDPAAFLVSTLNCA